MEVTDRRDLPNGGVIEFEFAPAGWLTKTGETRAKDWRAYYYTTPAGERSRLPSTSTVLECVFPKPGLPPWAEARGIEGAVRAVQLGAVDLEAPEEAVGIVRSLGLGADRARDAAATRGLNVHDLLREYMQTGSPPRRADHPAEQHGYIQALAKFLLARDLKPEAIEEMVCSPDDGYAGRTDLVARAGGLRIRYDAKTQERGQIYEGAHAQVRLYDRAAVAMGAEPADQLYVVVFAENGEWREMPCLTDESTVSTMLAWWRALRPVASACESANRAERKARA